MEIEFNTRQLERCYTNSSTAARQWGTAVGRRYLERLNLLRQIRAFPELYNYSNLRLHPLHPPYTGKFAITLIGRYRLIIGPGETDEHLIIYEVTPHYDD